MRIAFRLRFCRSACVGIQAGGCGIMPPLNQRTICRRDCHEREKIICIHAHGLRPLAAAGGASRCYAGKISAQHPSLCCVAGQRGGHEGCRDGMEGTFSPAAASTIYHQHRACRAERPAPLPRQGGLPRKISEYAYQLYAAEQKIDTKVRNIGQQKCYNDLRKRA